FYSTRRSSDLKPFHRECLCGLGEVFLDTAPNVLEEFGFPVILQRCRTFPMTYRNENVGIVGISHEFEIGAAGHILDGSLGSSVDFQEVVDRLGDKIHSNDSYNHGSPVTSFNLLFKGKTLLLEGNVHHAVIGESE